jgi:acetyl esterase/lipase
MSAQSAEADDQDHAPSYIGDDGLIAVSGFLLPTSSLIDSGSRTLFIHQARQWEAIQNRAASLAIAGGAMATIRDNYSEGIGRDLDRQMAAFDGSIRRDRIAGVPVVIFEPARITRHYQLINIHGGGFSMGRGAGAAIESMPACTSTGARVISIEYSLAPEHSPREALAEIGRVFDGMASDGDPGRIGIFGSSAGALLTAQFTSSRIGARRPLPGAIALLAMGASWIAGDSAKIFCEIDRVRGLVGTMPDYMARSDPDDHDIFPLQAPSRLALFPPAFLASSTRDVALSSVVDTHARIVAAGGTASLHIWEGLRHCFYYDPEFPQSRDLYRAFGDFFDRSIG